MFVSRNTVYAPLIRVLSPPGAARRRDSTGERSGPELARILFELGECLVALTRDQDLDRRIHS
jgi:hypothetical protein